MSGKVIELSHMLLLSTNKMSYMGSPNVPLHFSLIDLEKIKLMVKCNVIHILTLISQNRVELRLMLLFLHRK